MSPQTLLSVLPESNILQLYTINTLNRKHNNVTVITQVISQNNCTQEKGDEDWLCLDMNDKLHSLHCTTGRIGIKWPSNWVRHKDSTDVVTKGKSPFPIRNQISVVQPTASNPDNHVCRTTISITLHDFYNDVVYKLQEVREE